MIGNCGEDSCTFCHRVRCAGGSYGVVWGNPGGCAVANIAVRRENKREGGECGDSGVTPAI